MEDNALHLPVHAQNLVNGQWVGTDQTIEVYNPANKQLVGTVPAAGASLVEESLQAAAKAFPSWSRLTAQARARLLRKAAQIVRERKEHISRLLTMEQGKPLVDARKEVEEAAYVLEYFAEEGVRIYGEMIPVDHPAARSLVIRQPVGPIAAITPWNYPVSLLAWKVAPALAAGCTVVAKPATETPLSPIAYIQCLADAGIPAGVVNIVTGRGSTAGDALIGSPLVKKIAFTGSTEIGKEVMRKAADHLSLVSLELGGHSPFIVMADADLEQAAQDGARRAFRAMGQNCNSVNRIYVHESIYKRFVELLVEFSSRLKMGDGLKNPDIDLGPMVNEQGIRRIEDQVRDALEHGGKLLLGGKRPDAPELQNGYFYEPTIIAEAGPGAKVLREESFAPIVHVQPFATTEEVIRLANDNPYGLVSYLYTNDLSNAILISEALESGTVCVNNTVGSTVEAPYGGWKASGIGVELSHYGIESYTHLKHIRLQLRGL